MMRRHALLVSTAILSCTQIARAQTTNSASGSPPSSSTDDAQGAGLQDIIVTAQKRSQSLSDVPITVSVASGQQLASRGVTDTSELGKIVSGFVFVPAPFGQPVYVLRGVGLYDSGLGSAPTVSVYVDQVSLPFSLMTQGAALDLERVEVLKGPQGTLFGTNNTGGAINYIAAKPTEHFALGGSAAYERFGKATLTGYISGPLSDTVRARLAVQSVTGGAWQKSLTRDADLGNNRQLMGRLLVDIDPTDTLKISLNINGFRDRSDTQAAQLKEIALSNPANPYPEFAASPLAGSDAREADWDPLAPNRKNEKFYQVSGRIDYNLSDDITLTSISAYSDLRSDRYLDIDGSAVQSEAFRTFGRLKDFNQEVRVQGTSNRLIWMVGSNYQHSHTSDNNQNFVDMLSANITPFGPFTRSASYTIQAVNNYAVFANAEYKLAPRLTFQAGARYTWSRRHANSCAFDNTPGKPLNSLFALLQSLFAPGVQQAPIMQCYQLDPNNNFSAGPTIQDLNENNLSYRSSLSYKTGGGTLIFGSVSRGYKGGVISNIGASSARQFRPVKQERLDAYEVGVKAPLFERRIFVNVSGFYYDYANKQIRERIDDPVFGNQELLVPIPKSRTFGMDADLSARVVKGLTVTASGTYLNSKITSDFQSFNGAPVFDQSLQTGNFKGSRLSYTPRFTGNLDLQYDHELNSGLRLMLGASLGYHSSDNAGLKPQGGSLNPKFDIPQYALLDLRAGLSSADDRWTLEVFGRNVTNKYYFTTVFQDLDDRHVYAGMPATYGVRVGFRY